MGPPIHLSFHPSISTAAMELAGSLDDLVRHLEVEDGWDGQDPDSAILLEDLDLEAIDDPEDQWEDDPEDPAASPDSRPGPKGRMSYTLAKKKQVLALLESNGNNVYKTVKELQGQGSKIGKGCIMRWRSEKDKIMAASDTRDTAIRTRRKLPKTLETMKQLAAFPELELQLFQWFKRRRDAREAVVYDSVHTEMMRLYHELPDPKRHFVASLSWFTHWQRRYGISYRAPTSIGQKVPTIAKDLAISFFKFINNLCLDMEDKAIANMDEVPLYFDMPHKKTLAIRGEKTVSIQTTGHEKDRFTVVLCAMASGRKKKPAIIFKNLKKVPRDPDMPSKNRLFVDACLGGSMGTEQFLNWRENVWKSLIGSHFRKNQLLVMDSAPSHKHKSVKSVLVQHDKTKIAIIPGGMTPLLQPADLSWNKPFKANMRRLWSDWIRNGEKKYTKGGNQKKPGYGLIGQWVVQAWEEVDKDIIINSFKYCGITGNQHTDLHSKLKAAIDGDTVDEEPVPELQEETDAEEEFEAGCYSDLDDDDYEIEY